MWWALLGGTCRSIGLEEPRSHGTKAMVSDSVNLPSLAKTPFHAKIADEMRIYAIGDVHGRGDLLQPMLARIDAYTSAYPTPRPILVFLGDYIDRGPSSREVIDQLVLLNKQREVVFLEGNHEYYLMKFLKNPPFLTDWLRYGGLDTLRSYGIFPKNYLELGEQELLATSLNLILHENGHHDFLSNLRRSFVCGDFFFVHAGVRPGVPLDQQSQRDLLEIRNDFLSSKSDFGKIVVHGHTPVTRPDVRLNRINIDTGAYATGKLSCIIIERDEIRFV